MDWTVETFGTTGNDALDSRDCLADFRDSWERRRPGGSRVQSRAVECSRVQSSAVECRRLAGTWGRRRPHGPMRPLAPAIISPWPLTVNNQPRSARRLHPLYHMLHSGAVSFRHEVFSAISG